MNFNSFPKQYPKVSGYTDGEDSSYVTLRLFVMNIHASSDLLFITKTDGQNHLSTGYPLCKKPVKLTIHVKQREQRGKNNEEKNSNSCATKKNITGFYIEDESFQLPTDSWLRLPLQTGMSSFGGKFPFSP